MHFRRIIFACAIVLCLSGSLLAQTGNIQHNKIIVVDTRTMLLAHPLFSSFDPQTRRFKGTRSEPISGEESRNFIKADLESNQQALAKYNEDWSQKLKSATGKQRQKLESQYIQGRRRYENRVSESRQRYWAVMSIPGVPGFTEPASIITQTNKIAEDIRNSILQLRKKTGAGLVIDISSMMPSSPVPYKIEILQINRLENLDSPQKIDARLLEWVKEARNYWMNHGNVFRPFIIGTEDMRVEAVEELIRQCQGEN